MRFPRSFTRVVGDKNAGVPLSEHEGPPMGCLDEVGAAASLAADNVLVSRQASTMGWPVQRVAVAWIAPEGPALDDAGDMLDLHAWIFDHRTGFWLASTVLRAPSRKLCVVDVPSLLDCPTAGRKSGQMTGPQSLEVLIAPRPIAKVARTYRPGVYTFVFGADVSSTP